MVDYDELLKANKKAYTEGTIDKGAYDKEARKIRRLRRRAGQAPSQKNGKSQKTIEGVKKGKTSGRKKKTRKKKTRLSIPMDTILEEARATFKKAGMKKLKKAKLDKPYHGFASSALQSLKEETPETDVGQLVIDKFTSRWAKAPTVYAEVRQGSQVIFYVGEVEEK